MVSKCLVLIYISLITDNGKQSFMIITICFVRNAYAYILPIFFFRWVVLLNLDLYIFFKQIFFW